MVVADCGQVGALGRPWNLPSSDEPTQLLGEAAKPVFATEGEYILGATLPEN
jgi:hypothetical protein